MEAEHGHQLGLRPVARGHHEEASSLEDVAGVSQVQLLGALGIYAQTEKGTRNFFDCQITIFSISCIS